MALTDIYRALFGKDHIQDGTVIDLAEHGRTGGVSTGQAFKFSRKVDELIKVDEASATVTYIGTASFGTASSASSWQVKRITISGTVTTIEYADLGNYSQVFDDRASLNYS
jgi:hypothetical protein